MRSRILRSAALLAPLVAGAPAIAACPAFTELGQTALEPPAVATPGGNPRHYREWIYQEFPGHALTNESSVSAWTIHVIQRSHNNSNANLVPVIADAIYTTTEGKQIDVLDGLWPQQIIVPYAQSTDVVHDLWLNQPLVSLTEREASLAPCGEVGPAIYPRNWRSARFDLAPPGSPRSIYVKEIRDSGTATASFAGHDELFGEAAPSAMRRGRELVIWGVVDASNYDNIIEYRFRDDGEVSAVVGPTGWNTPVGAPYRAQSGNTPHAHTVLWRIQPGLLSAEGGPRVAVAEYRQWSEHGGDPTEHESETPVTTEQAIAFDPARFTTLRITDPDSFNDARPGKPPQPNTYVLSLISDGTPRHRMWAEDDVVRQRYDFAVLNAGAEEILSEPFPNPRFPYLDELIDGKPLTGGDLAIYAYSTIAHLPRAEDFIVHPGDPEYEDKAQQNVTAVRWSGIRLTPRNVYTDVPFSRATPGARSLGAVPPLTPACAPLAAAPTLEPTTCSGSQGVPEYAVGLSPINRNPFGREATSVTVTGLDLLGGERRIDAPIAFGEAHAIAPSGQGLVVRPSAGRPKVCLQVSMSGDGWRCPGETVCVPVPKDACDGG